MANPQNLKPFPKGVSGNPGGKRKLTQEDRDALELLRQGAPAAAKLLLGAVNGKRPSVGQVQAAKDVLDRVYGRAIQTSNVALSDQRGYAIVPARMKDEEWKKYLEFKRSQSSATKLPETKPQALPAADTLRTQPQKPKILQ